MTRRQVVVTGLGSVTPLAGTWAATWSAMLAGRSGVGPWPFFDASGYPAAICGAVAVEDVDPRGLPSRELARLGRPARMGVRAADEALAAAGLPAVDFDPGRGVFFGHSVGRPTVERLHELAQHGVVPQVSPREALVQEPNVGLNLMARRMGAGGPVVGVSTACAASGHAIGEAMRAIEEGDVDVALAGGTDSLTSWIDLLGFSLLGALTTSWNHDPQGASRPFSGDRDGFVIGEGAVALVLESLEHARRRGASVLAHLDGYASSLNAYRVTDSPPDGSGAYECMTGALDDATWEPQSVDLVVAHGTSTPGNDAAETRAVRRTLGHHADEVVVAAPKGSVGHLTAASAALGVALAVQAIQDGTVPPTLNLTEAGPGCELDHAIARPRPGRYARALVNAFAFGGTNACIAVSRGGRP